MSTAKNLRPAIFLLAALIAGCANAPGLVRQTKFERTARAYEKAIRWSEFGTARLFLKESAGGKNPPDLDKLKMIKVIEYEVKETSLAPDQSRVLQVAEIQYYRDDAIVVKTVTDRQVWEYDPAFNNWYLVSGLPDFK
jgi:hypothetical protein